MLAEIHYLAIALLISFGASSLILMLLVARLGRSDEDNNPEQHTNRTANDGRRLKFPSRASTKRCGSLPAGTTGKAGDGGD